MSVEERQTIKRASPQTSDEAELEQAHTPTRAEVLQRHAEGRHPMGSVGGWMRDFGTLGASAGLSLAAGVALLVPSIASQSSAGLLALALPLILGGLGACAGGVAGSMLRGLRGRVSAVAGIVLASMGANLVASTLALSTPEALSFATSAFLGRAGPLSLAVTLLIPFAAVLRWRGRTTMPWMLTGGFIAGLLITLSHL